MAKRGKPFFLDDAKRREILAIVAVGGTRRLAAAYVGCSVRTIRRTANRLPEFADELGRQERSPELAYLGAIRKAAEETKHWRAAAWALERLHPERYGRRNPQVMTLDQVRRLMAQLAEILSEEVPQKYRKNVLKRLGAVFADLGQVPQERTTANGS